MIEIPHYLFQTTTYLCHDSKFSNMWMEATCKWDASTTFASWCWCNRPGASYQTSYLESAFLPINGVSSYFRQTFSTALPHSWVVEIGSVNVKNFLAAVALSLFHFGSLVFRNTSARYWLWHTRSGSDVVTCQHVPRIEYCSTYPSTLHLLFSSQASPSNPLPFLQNLISLYTTGLPQTNLHVSDVFGRAWTTSRFSRRESSSRWSGPLDFYLISAMQCMSFDVWYFLRIPR